VTLEPARKRAQAQWHFQRFVEHFPSKGRLVIFDGSWYHQPAIEHAIGISDHEEFAGFLKACAEFERTLGNSGIFLIKYWFSASGEEQDARFRSHIEELRKAKVLKLPRNLPHPPAAVHQVQAAVMALTNVETARWRVIDAEDKRAARLACMADLLSIATGALASPAPDPVADNI
jgi:polyphosphate kinase 2 (PPK2 family)